MAAAAPEISQREISRIADWYFHEDTLRAATVDLVNYASNQQISQVWGCGDTCSADGVRFYVPVNVLSSDYSAVLQARGVTMLAHTADNFLQLHQRVIPCRLREATFVLDGLMEHDTELDPQVCFTDTHGYTEVVMAAAHLLGFELAPRIRDVKDQTLYRFTRDCKFESLEPLITGTIRPHLIRQSWDQVVRVIASIHSRLVSPSLVLNRLSSYARQNSIYQGLQEIGRALKTMHILHYLDSEDFRRQIGRELNKGESSHDLSRFLCFGKEGALRGREFEDQLHTFSCLSVLHNAVVAWNIERIQQVTGQLRNAGHEVDDVVLSRTSPLIRKHINPFGRYHFNLARMTRA